MGGTSGGGGDGGGGRGNGGDGGGGAGGGGEGGGGKGGGGTGGGGRGGGCKGGGGDGEGGLGDGGGGDKLELAAWAALLKTGTPAETPAIALVEFVVFLWVCVACGGPIRSSPRIWLSIVATRSARETRRLEDSYAAGLTVPTPRATASGASLIVAHASSARSCIASVLCGSVTLRRVYVQPRVPSMSMATPRICTMPGPRKSSVTKGKAVRPLKGTQRDPIKYAHEPLCESEVASDVASSSSSSWARASNMNASGIHASSAYQPCCSKVMLVERSSAVAGVAVMEPPKGGTRLCTVSCALPLMLPNAAPLTVSSKVYESPGRSE